MNRKDLLTAIKLLFFFTLLLGIIYPLIITAITAVFMQNQATGQINFAGNSAIGSKLIGQKFESERYFWGRPSAVDYNTIPSGGSNLSLTSTKLKKEVEERLIHLMRAHSVQNPKDVPPELLFTSASGVDPHISVAAALFQRDRVAKARSLPKETIEELILQSVESPFFGLLGVEVVNVFELNHRLNQVEP